MQSSNVEHSLHLAQTKEIHLSHNLFLCNAYRENIANALKSTYVNPKEVDEELVEVVSYTAYRTCSLSGYDRNHESIGMSP